MSELADQHFYEFEQAKARNGLDEGQLQYFNMLAAKTAALSASTHAIPAPSPVLPSQSYCSPDEEEVL